MHHLVVSSGGALAASYVDPGAYLLPGEAVGLFNSPAGEAFTVAALRPGRFRQWLVAPGQFVSALSAVAIVDESPARSVTRALGALPLAAGSVGFLLAGDIGFALDAAPLSPLVSHGVGLYPYQPLLLAALRSFCASMGQPVSAGLLTRAGLNYWLSLSPAAMLVELRCASAWEGSAGVGRVRGPYRHAQQGGL